MENMVLHASHSKIVAKLCEKVILGICYLFIRNYTSCNIKWNISNYVLI